MIAGVAATLPATVASRKFDPVIPNDYCRLPAGTPLLKKALVDSNRKTTPLAKHYPNADINSRTTFDGVLVSMQTTNFAPVAGSHLRVIHLSF